jgi:TfoX/Sxy family transcriptional regulator of competence genes
MKKKPAAMANGELDPGFVPLARAFEKDREVTVGKMFGSTGLKVNGKVFAMVVKGRFVAKLPKDRVDGLVASGDGEHFDPGHGKLMKEWVSVPSDRTPWLKLAREARRFVKGGAR